MAKSDNRTGALGTESRLWDATDLLRSNIALSEYGYVVPGLISLKYIERFPDEFMFQLTKAEFEDWKSQIVISNKELMGLRKAPYVFTEAGVSMLSAVLKSGMAIRMSVEIIRAFVQMQLSKRPEGVSATILTKTASVRLRQDLKKHNAQYASITVLEFSHSHDRFLILDGELVYHIGASLKDLGKKWFAFSRMDKDALAMMERIESVLKENVCDGQ